MTEKRDLGSTDEIDYRTKVGSDAWRSRLTPDAQKLSAWRRLHALLPHAKVKAIANLEMSGKALAKVAERIEAKQKGGG